MPIMTENKKTKIMIGEPDKLRKIWSEQSVVYSSGNICYYHITTTNIVQVEIDEGDSCIPYKGSTPTLSGWTFVGWRSDTNPDPSVLSSKIMGEDPIHLYAVFRQTVTVSYNGNGNTGGSTANQSAYRYYNNGYTVNPSFTLRRNGFTKTGYVFSSWRDSRNGVLRKPGDVLSLGVNVTFYAVYLEAQVSTTWDKLKVYPWPGKGWTGYHTVWAANGLNTTDYTEEEIADQTRCWVSGGWVEVQGDHTSENTNCLKAYIDCSVYRGIILPLHIVMHSNWDKLSCNMDLYLSGGGTELKIASSRRDADPFELTQSFQLNFTQTSGTTNVLIHNVLLPNTGAFNDNWIKAMADVSGTPILLRRDNS